MISNESFLSVDKLIMRVSHHRILKVWCRYCISGRLRRWVIAVLPHLCNQVCHSFLAPLHLVHSRDDLGELEDRTCNNNRRQEFCDCEVWKHYGGESCKLLVVSVV
jgi:hypothetical protein